MNAIAARKMPSPAIRAQAAAWLARLRGPNRLEETEEGFRLWLAAAPEHATAFEMASETWERSARLQRRPHEQVMSWEQPGFRMSFTRATAAAAAVAACTIVATVLYLRTGAVTTAIGEQRTVTLEDGSRVFLNTDTRAVVEFSGTERRVRLDRGEALFEVARRPDRPFIVAAGEARIEALGTSFVVRHEAQRLAVTLVEGRITVKSDSSSGARTVSELRPGERLTFSAAHAATLDTPVLDKLTAWQRGQVAFDNTRLSDAIEEMNRYSTVKLSIERPEAASIRIGGIFRAGDATSFAQAMAETYRLQAHERNNEIVLSGVPDSPESSRPQ